MAAGIVAYAAAAAYQRHATRVRWKRFMDAGLVAEPATVSSLPIRRVIEIDLGYGKEVWLLFGEELDLDKPSRVFRDAKVFPRSETLPKDLVERMEFVSWRS